MREQDDTAGASLNDLLDEGRAIHLQDGTPLFYAHCPRDNRILAHIGDKKKLIVFEPATLSEVVLSNRPGPFRSPQWLPHKGPRGEELVMFVEEAEGGVQPIVLAEAKAAGGSEPSAPGRPRPPPLESFQFLGPRPHTSILDAQARRPSMRSRPPSAAEHHWRSTSL